MNQHPAATDWASARGEKWSAQLEGMEAMLDAVNDPLIDALALTTPLAVAEVGCGGGGTAFEIARRAPAGSTVHGFDISPSLIRIARERLVRLNRDASGVAFHVADMASAAPERRYDRLVSRFGVMFFDDPPNAFANLSRWLAPEGRFAFAVWGRPSDNPWIGVVRDVVDGLIDIPSLEPNAPGPFRYAEVDAFLALLTDAGFADLQTRDWRGTLPIGGASEPAEAARFALTAFSSFGELLAAAGHEALTEAHRLLTTSFARHYRDGAVRLEACVHVVTGRKP